MPPRSSLGPMASQIGGSCLNLSEVRLPIGCRVRPRHEAKHASTVAADARSVFPILGLFFSAIFFCENAEIATQTHSFFFHPCQHAVCRSGRVVLSPRPNRSPIFRSANRPGRAAVAGRWSCFLFSLLFSPFCLDTRETKSAIPKGAMQDAGPTGAANRLSTRAVADHADFFTPHGIEK